MLEEHNEKQIRYYDHALYQNLRPEATPYILRQIREVLDFGEICSGDLVLEVGCGVGRYTLNLPNHDIFVEGLDLSDKNLKKFQKFNKTGLSIPLHCCDIVDMPVTLKSRYNAVIGFFVLHHLYDLKACFEAMFEVVKPGGIVIFMEPNPYNFLFYIGITCTNQGSWSVDKGIFNMRAPKIFDYLNTVGFEKCATKKFGIFPPFLANEKWGRKIESFIEALGIFYPFLAFQLFKARKPII